MASIHLTDPKDRDFYQYLLEHEVIAGPEFSRWDVPDEGELLPVLATNQQRLNLNAYLGAGLKANPRFLRVPGLEPDWSVCKEFPRMLLYDTLDSHKVLPIRRISNYTWFLVGRYHPFNFEFLKNLSVPEDKIALNIATPKEWALYVEEFRNTIPSF